MSSISLLTVSLFGSSSYRRPNISRASSQRSILHSQRGLSGSEKMEMQTRNERNIVNANGKRHDTELGCVYDMPKATHNAKAIPDPQKIPKAETCWPRFSAFDTSDCHTETVAIMPPVPRPSTIRPTMKCAKAKDEHWRIAPIACTTLAMKIVFRRPRTSPRKVQPRAPNTPKRVYNATTVPVGNVSVSLHSLAIADPFAKPNLP